MGPVALVVVFACVFLGFTWGCLSTHEQGVACLSQLEPLVKKLIRWFFYPRDHLSVFYHTLFVSIWGLTLALALFSLLTRRWITVQVCLAVALAMGGEYFILQKNPSTGTLLTLALPWVLALVTVGWKSQSDSEQLGWNPISRWELLALGVMSLAFFCTLFFALNYIPAGWDTEFCPYRHVYWTRWEGLLRHDAGYHPQSSAGLAWNFLYTLLGHTDEPDLYYLFIRFLSSAISALKFIALFLFTRSLFGTFAAFLSLAIMGFGPPENWWSREPTLHQLPGLLAIPLLWSWIAAWQRPTWIRFLLLAICMLAPRFAYPSGLFLSFGPPIFFAILLAFRWREWRQHIFKMSLMVPSLALWLGWRTIAKGLHLGDWTLQSPLPVPDHFAPTSLAERVSMLATNVVAIFDSNFIYQVNPTHWTTALVLAPERCVTSIVIVLFLLALARFARGKAGQLGLLLMIALGLTFVPGILSEVAARRIGVSFLILTLIAVREAAYLMRLVEQDRGRILAKALKVLVPTAAAVYFGWIASAIHFSQRRGIPSQVARGALIRSAIQNDSLVVYLSGLASCDLFYSVYRDLKSRNCNVGWVSADFDGSPDTDTLIESPAIRPKSWVYELTGMNACLEDHRQRNWSTIQFVIGETQITPALIQKVQARYPQAALQELSEPDFYDGAFKVFVLTVHR